jgi:hypothetical protein
MRRHPLETRYTQGEEIKMTSGQEEKLVERRVTEALELNGKFCIIENVPARGDEEAGEQLFSP